MRNKEMYYTNSKYGVSNLMLLPSEEPIKDPFITCHILTLFITGQMDVVKTSWRRGYVSRNTMTPLMASITGEKLPLVCEYRGTRYDATHIMFLPSEDSTRFCLAVYIRPKYVPYLDCN